MTSELNNKLKLKKSNYIFIGISLICFIALLNALNYMMPHQNIITLPQAIKRFLLRYSPMFGMILSFFLWHDKTIRPKKLYIALFIISFCI